MIQQSEFCGYAQYTIQSDTLSVTVTTFGATVRSIRFAGQELALSYPDIQEYLDGTSYIGAIVGRYANRIRKGKITLNGETIQLACNENGNQLHGGPQSFDCRQWSAEVLGENAVKFSLLSPAGDNGYPGNLHAVVTYRVEGGTLHIDFEGDSDADTIYAPTTHMYLHLGDAETILENKMEIHATGVVEVDKELLPTGKILPCEGDFDFRQPRAIERAYDHCFILNDRHACTVTGGGVTLELETDYPALQFYAGEFLGGRHKPYAGFAIEPGLCPDSPNHPEFASPLLRKGEHFHKFAEYRFSRK